MLHGPVVCLATGMILFFGVLFMLAMCRREWVRYKLSRLERNRNDKAWRKWYRFEIHFLLPLALFLTIVGAAAAAAFLVYVWIAGQ